LRPGVKRLAFEAKAAGVALAIATTATLEGVRTVLSQDEKLAAAFDVIAAGDVVPRKKPAPDVYEWVLERLGVGPLECIAIEDSAVGLTASSGAGIPTLVAVSSAAGGQGFPEALAVLSDLGEPGAPATCLAGPAPKNGVVDLPYLVWLLERLESERLALE